MPFRSLNPRSPSPARPHSPKHVLLVQILRQQGDWTPLQVRRMMAGEYALDPILDNLATFVKANSILWDVSDAELLAALGEVNPSIAALLATPAGLNFLHDMSRKLAFRTAGKLITGFFGG